MSVWAKRPPTVRAWQFNGEARDAWPEWLKSHAFAATGANLTTVEIGTRGGGASVYRGDWIVLNGKGELSAFGNAAMRRRYELIDPND